MCSCTWRKHCVTVGQKRSALRCDGSGVNTLRYYQVKGCLKIKGSWKPHQLPEKIEDFDHPGGLEVTWSSSHFETSRWWFQTFLIFSPYLGKIPILTSIVFSTGLETTTTWEIIHAKCFLTDSQKLWTRQVSSLQGLKVTYIAAGEAAARTWQQIIYIYICANMYIYLTVHIYIYIYWII